MVAPWTYEKQGSDWLSDFSQEAKGVFQSPIDLPVTDVIARSQIALADKEIIFDYHHVPGACKVKHVFGRSIEVSPYSDFSLSIPFGEILLDGKWFAATSIHFHSPAEHLFDGHRYPLELHVVHKLVKETPNDGKKILMEDDNEVCVVGVMFEASETASPFLEALLSIDNFPLHPDTDCTSRCECTANCDLNLKALLQSDASENSVSFMRYSGSLTTPPLSGPVNWIIRSRPVLALQKQIKAFSSAFRYPNTKGNYRSCSGRRGKVCCPSQNKQQQLLVSENKKDITQITPLDLKTCNVWLARGLFR